MRNLPFRFALTPSLAKKWQLLSVSQQQDLFDQFSYKTDLWYDSSLESKVLSAEAYVQDRFAEASEAAACLDLRLDVYALCFSQDVSRLLRKGKPVLGEVELAAQWAKSTGLQYQLEQVCAVGRIDILLYELGNKTVIVEAKFAESWKHALGQVLAYQYCLGSKDYDAALLLVGDRIEVAEDCAASYGVKVHWLAS